MTPYGAFRLVRSQYTSVSADVCYTMLSCAVMKAARQSKQVHLCYAEQRPSG